MPALSDLKSENLVTRGRGAATIHPRQLSSPELNCPRRANWRNGGRFATFVKPCEFWSQGLLEISQGRLPCVLPPNTQVVIDGLSTLMGAQRHAGCPRSAAVG